MGLGVPAAPQLLAPTLKAPNSPPSAATAPHPSARRRRRRLERNTDATGRMDTAPRGAVLPGLGTTGLLGGCGEGWGPWGSPRGSGTGVGWQHGQGRVLGGPSRGQAVLRNTGCHLLVARLPLPATQTGGSQPPALVPVPAVPWGCPTFAPRHGSPCLCLLSIPRSESGSRKKRRHR